MSDPCDARRTRSDIRVVVCTAGERLEALVADGKTARKHVWRARIVLLTAAGCGTMETMRRVGKFKPTVWRRRKRFMEQGVDGAGRQDAPAGQGAAGP